MFASGSGRSARSGRSGFASGWRRGSGRSGCLCWVGVEVVVEVVVVVFGMCLRRVVVVEG